MEVFIKGNILAIIPTNSSNSQFPTPPFPTPLLLGEFLTSCKHLTNIHIPQPNLCDPINTPTVLLCNHWTRFHVTLLHESNQGENPRMKLLWYHLTQPRFCSFHNYKIWIDFTKHISHPIIFLATILINSRTKSHNTNKQ